MGFANGMEDGNIELRPLIDDREERFFSGTNFRLCGRAKICAAREMLFGMKFSGVLSYLSINQSIEDILRRALAG